MQNRARAVWMLPVVFGACGLGLEEPGLGSEVSTVVTCPWGCSNNTASLGDGMFFHELDLGLYGRGGAANDGHIRITGVIGPQGQQVFSLAVENVALDSLVGKFKTARFVDKALIGTRILLSHSDGSTFELRITDFMRTPFWVGTASAPSYAFQVIQKTGPNQVNNPPLPTAPLCPPSDTGEQQLALVFRGDRYNTQEKTVLEDLTGSWVNIACAKSAQAKLHLLRHTRAGMTPLFKTTVPERQAMLKMFIADYCGDGTVFTENDHPLRYADHRGWYPDGIDLADPLQRKQLEAVWAQDGARCLDTPRLHLRSEVTSHCEATSSPRTIPACPDDMTGWKTDGHVVSVNPPPSQ